MPIDIDRFKDEDALRDPPTSERIIRFLIEHDDNAYTRGEIADAIDANPETVGTNLTRLKDRGLVRHREPYWAVTDDRERAITTLRDRYDDAALTDLLGTEDGTEWKAHAITPDEFNTPRGDIDADGTPEADNTGASSSTKPPTNPHREAAAAFFERVRDRLDTILDALYLFGSVARASATADSDVDVLAVISDDADYATVDDQLLDIAYDIQLEYGVRVEVHSIQASEFAARKERGDPFIRTVVQEGETGV
jgi:predicted nucleotidyltransferase/DNA-binding transcriptional ArsR family regulator